jgi:tRNA-specific 2-thiouridylase
MKILVALSGGVDSSVAAAILLEQGHSVMAATLKTFCYSDISGGPKSCCGLEGIDSAKSVAAALGIPHTVFDVSKRFANEVIADFVAEYAEGRTPNPCVRCNASVKIPDLLERATQLGCDAVATGHYARIITDPSAPPQLWRGDDPVKDQSYFLWALPSGILNRVFLPIGHLTKPQVREIAGRLGLTSAEKPESQEICFVPDGDYAAFCRRHLPADHPGLRPGFIKDSQGQPIGHHQGFLHFTIGQRKGLGGGHGRRLFVTAINAATREVFIGPTEETWGTHFQVDHFNRLDSDEWFEHPELSVQIRHRAPAVPVVLTATSSQVWDFRLKQPARAITPGQSAVFYVGNRLLGGGRIISSRR